MPRLTKAQWKEIKDEWVAGNLGVREIARTFGIDKKTLTDRAAREQWPERNEVSDVVKAITPSNTPNANETPQVGVNHRIALQSFDRVIQLLRMHRKDLGYLHAAILANLQRVEKIVNKRLESGQPLRLKEEQMVADILAKAANSLARLVPLERRAFGLGVEEISEFDSFTNEQLDALENTVRKALGS